MAASTSPLLSSVSKTSTKGYYDFGSSSEGYCNPDFLELETLSGINHLDPGESASHIETWEIFGDVIAPEDETIIQEFVDQLGME